MIMHTFLVVSESRKDAQKLYLLCVGEQSLKAKEIVFVCLYAHPQFPSHAKLFALS